MNSRKGSGKGSYALATGGSSKRRDDDTSGSVKSNTSTDQLSQEMANTGIDSGNDGDWEVYSKKSKCRNNIAASKPRGTSNTNQKVWGYREAGNASLSSAGGGGKPPGNKWTSSERGNPRPQSGRSWEAAYTAPPVPSVGIAPPLQQGWNWAGRNGAPQKPYENETAVSPGFDTQRTTFAGGEPANETLAFQADDDSEEDELAEDSDDDLSDEYDSDASQKSHETRKKSSWFRVFFEQLDKLTTEQVNETTRQWHCPACKGGPGEIDWYTGLQPLMTHAKTKGSKRRRLHREFADLLEEEIRKKGTSVVPPGEVFGKWKGLRDEVPDREIVWPPMVVIMNTQLDKDDNDKWIGMGNQELIEYFNGYAAVKARHSYGPRGHRGMSVLIFEASAVGYVEAERLDKHLKEERTDRAAWQSVSKRLFCPGGKRQLYGFLAEKEDLELFNQHSQGKTRLKFEMRSYKETVVSQMRQMSEDNQQLSWIKSRYAKQEQHKKNLEEQYGVVTQRLRETIEENRIVRERTTEQDRQYQEQMDFQERFFKEQMERVQQTTIEKEKQFERLLQEERAKATRTHADSGTKEDRRRREEQFAQFIHGQVKDVEEFEAAREELMRMHEDKKVALRRKHLEEEVELEKEFDAKLTELMTKCSHGSFSSTI